MTRYIELVKRALFKVEQRYYRIPVIYSQTEINRERVFCYELYHRMRNEMDEGMELSLHAEIDKSGNPDFNKQNPDFVFHKPGTNEFNELVCEVKGALDWAGIEKDFRTILTLIIMNNYGSGVFVLYNYTLQELLNRRNVIQAAAMLVPESDREIVLSKVLVLAIPDANHEIECMSLSQILSIGDV